MKVFGAKTKGGWSGGVIENENHIDCQYVHELQHALRLANINKEIVL